MFSILTEKILVFICEGVFLIKRDYKKREIKLINRLLKNLFLINTLPTKVFPKKLPENSIIQVGNNVEEKLFLLNFIVEEVINRHELYKERKLDKAFFNENVIELIDSLKYILQDIEPVYVIKVLEVPGVEIPCSNIFEAKEIANDLSFDTQIIYKDQVVFTAT